MCHEIIPQHQNSFKIDSGRNRGKEAKLITLITHIYMPPHFTGLVQTLQ